MLRRDPSHPSFHVLFWAPGLTSTQRKLDPHLGAWAWIVVAAAMGDAYSVCQNTSLGVALPTPSRSVDPLCASSAFLCIDTSEIWIHLLKPQLQPWYHRKCKVPLRAAVHPIYTSYYDTYAWSTPMCHCKVPRGALRLTYCCIMLRRLWS